MMYKLGKLPHVPDPNVFKLVDLADAHPLPKPPNRFGHGYSFKDWKMLANDQYGCCVLSDAGHQTMLTNKLAQRVVTIRDQDVLDAYSAITGFDPAKPETDNGTNMGEALSWRRHVGISDSRGTRHKIGAYVSIDPTNFDQIAVATYAFTTISWGFQFPTTAWSQFDEHEPWDPVEMDSSSIDGGHDVPIVGRASANTLTCVTWGRRQTMTRQFVREYGDEAYAIIFPEELRNGRTWRGYPLADLQAWLAAL